MNAFPPHTDFSHLLSSTHTRKRLLEGLNALKDPVNNPVTDTMAAPYLAAEETLNAFLIDWQSLSMLSDTDDLQPSSTIYDEQAACDWLIQLFNTLFAQQTVVLTRSTGEPEYIPAQGKLPARIEFAHGFFASALHEISHWCIAGEARRRCSDFGYWYAPDGRSAAQQQAFERVEIKPQALECLFTRACRRPFQVSQDNLFADFDTSRSTFSHDVYQQAKAYIANPQTLPRDAKTLLHALLYIVRSL